jgi:hypothetical protein
MHLMFPFSKQYCKVELHLHSEAKIPPEDGGGHYFATIDLRKHCVIISFPAVEAIIMSNKAFILKGGDGFVRLMHKTYYGPKAAGRIVTSLPWEELILECCLMRVCSNTQTHKHTDAHRDTETQRHRDTETQRHRDTETQTHRHTDTQTHRHTDTQTHRHTDTQTHRHRHAHTEQPTLTTPPSPLGIRV